MTRKKHGSYPSEHRRYFRVQEDILDDPKLDDELPADVFRFYFRLLAMLNRTKSKDGSIVLSKRALCLLAGRERHGYALATASSGAVAELYSLSHRDGKTFVTVPKWAENQGFARTGFGSDSDEIPVPNPTPTPNPNTKHINMVPAPDRGTLFPDPIPPDWIEEIASYLVRTGSPRSVVRRKAEFVLAAAAESEKAADGKARKSRRGWLAFAKRGIRHGYFLKGWDTENARYQAISATAPTPPENKKVSGFATGELL